MKRGRFARSRLRRRISAETGRVSNHLHPLLVKKNFISRSSFFGFANKREKEERKNRDIRAHCRRTGHRFARRLAIRSSCLRADTRNSPQSGRLVKSWRRTDGDSRDS